MDMFQILFSSTCVKQNKKIVNCTNANIFHLKTSDDKRYVVAYSGRYKGTSEWFTNDNQGNYNPVSNNKDGNIDAFKLTHSGLNGFDICYIKANGQKLIAMEIL